MRPFRDRERLVDGLTDHERLAKVETRLFGTPRVFGLDREVEQLRGRLEELESVERRRQMGWLARWLLRWSGRR